MTNDELIKTAFCYLGKERDSRIWSWDIIRADFAHYRSMLNREKPNRNQIDYLSRSISLYLASWGMYRGSGDLLGNNYHQFDSIVPMLLEEKWWQNNLTLKDWRALYNDLKAEISSDLACQKIISGVFGCAVPFDSINKEGIGVWAKSALNRTGKRRFSLNKAFTMDNSPLYSFHFFAQPFDTRPDRYPLSETPYYPQGRLIDIYFFWIGSCIQNINWLQKNPERQNGPVAKKWRAIRELYGISDTQDDPIIAIQRLLPDEIIEALDTHY